MPAAPIQQARVVALINISGTDPRAAQVVEQACRLAKLQPVPWQQTPDGGWPTPEPPVVGIGILRADDRRVPAALGVATRLFPGLPIVLVAGEPLSREVILLNRAQLSLVDPSLSPERLAGHLQRVIHLTSRNTDATFCAHYSRVLRPTIGWAATVSRFPSAREVHESTLVYPWSTVTREGTLFGSVLTAWEHPAPVDVLTCQQVFVTLQAADEASSGRVGEILGTHGMAICANMDSVRIYAPKEAGAVWLMSPRRLPAVWRFSIPGGRVKILRPAPGDVFVLHTQADWSPPLDHPLDGAKLLRLLQQESSAIDDNPPFSAAILEVW